MLCNLHQRPPSPDHHHRQGLRRIASGPQHTDWHVLRGQGSHGAVSELRGTGRIGTGHVGTGSVDEQREAGGNHELTECGCHQDEYDWGFESGYEYVSRSVFRPCFHSVLHSCSYSFFHSYFHTYAHSHLHSSRHYPRSHYILRSCAQPPCIVCSQAYCHIIFRS